ncbi:hypothetical protein [Amphritea sp. HPY]|uniref:hypothetical protein n=1 Tax=Amphritea sp. HPY TaxID=3421652 RepID=UPI003D7D2E6A
MPDLATIGAALGSIKTATEIARLIKDSGSSLEQAEVKLHMAELLGALADAKVDVANIKLDLIDKDETISSLEEKIKTQGETVGFLGARYYVNDDGDPTGSPHCPTCWAQSKDLFPLLAWSNEDPTHKCGKCSSKVLGRQSPLDADYYIKSQREASVKIGGNFELKTTK